MTIMTIGGSKQVKLQSKTVPVISVYRKKGNRGTLRRPLSTLGGGNYSASSFSAGMQKASKRQLGKCHGQDKPSKQRANMGP